MWCGSREKKLPLPPFLPVGMPFPFGCPSVEREGGMAGMRPIVGEHGKAGASMFQPVWHDIQAVQAEEAQAWIHPDEKTTPRALPCWPCPKYHLCANRKCKGNHWHRLSGSWRGNDAVGAEDVRGRLRS